MALIDRLGGDVLIKLRDPDENVWDADTLYVLSQWPERAAADEVGTAPAGGCDQLGERRSRERRGTPWPTQTAIKVTDGTVEVVSEGHWKLFPPARKQANRAHETRTARLRQRSGMTP